MKIRSIQSGGSVSVATLYLSLLSPQGVTARVVAFTPRWRTRIARVLGLETREMREGRLSYHRGMRAEDRVAEHLKDEGWFVKRSRSSRGLHDIEAFRSGERVFMQVKHGSAWPSQDEISSLAKRAARKGASACIAYEYRGEVIQYSVCRWCCNVGEEGEEICSHCGQPF